MQNLFKRIKQHGLFLKNYRLQIKSLSTKWHDRDDVMLHANFQILVDFVEEELSAMYDFVNSKNKQLSKKDKGLLYIEQYLKEVREDRSNGSSSWCFSKEEIRDLYLWWKIERPKRCLYEVEANVLPPSLWFNELKRKEYFAKYPEVEEKFIEFKKLMNENCKLEEKWEVEDSVQLDRLIRIRDALWT